MQKTGLQNVFTTEDSLYTKFCSSTLFLIGDSVYDFISLNTTKRSMFYNISTKNCEWPLLIFTVDFLCYREED